MCAIFKTLSAMFVQLNNDRVELRRADGKTIRLSIAKLSKQDQEYVKQRASSSPLSAVTSSLFSNDKLVEPRERSNSSRKPGEYFVGDVIEVKTPFDGWRRGTVIKSKQTELIVLYEGAEDTDSVRLGGFPNKIRMFKANPNGMRLSNAGSPLSNADYDAVRSYDLAKMTVADTDGKFTPDVRSSRTGEKFDSFWIEVDPQGDAFFQETKAMLPLPARRRMLTINADGRGIQDDREVIFSLYDVAGGAPLFKQQLDIPVQLMAATPSGSLLATVEEGDFHDRVSTINLWQLNDKQLTKLRSWQPMANEFFKEVHAIAWIDDKRLAISSYGMVHIWDTQRLKLLWSINGEAGIQFQLSNQGKQIAVSDGKSLSVFDIETGACLQCIESSRGHDYGAIAFSPNGSLLAAIPRVGSEVDLINLETGQLFDTLNLQSRANAQKGFFWVDGEHILIGGQDLLHVPSKVIVWVYNHRASQLAYAHGLCWYLFRQSGSFKQAPKQRVTIVDLPHSAVANVPDEQLALRPGDSIALELELVTDMLATGGRSIRTDAELMLSKQLEEAGYVIVPEAETTLLAVMEPGETRNAHYTRFGRYHGDAETISVTPRKYRLELRQNGKKIWQREQVQEPSIHIRLQKGESIQQAIERIMEPDASWFGLGVPSRIMKSEIASTRHCSIGIDGLK